MLLISGMKNREDQTQKYLNYLWMFLEKRQGSNHHDSIATLAMLASLMYLQKKDALRIKYNANMEKDHSFLQIDAVFIYMVDPDMHKQWQANGYETLDLCSTLPDSDPLYEIVNNNLSQLSNTGTTIAALEIMKDIVSERIRPEQYLEILDGMLKYDREISIFGQPKEFAELAKKMLDVNEKSVFNPFSGLMTFASAFEGYKDYTGVELNREVANFSLLLLALADKTDNTTVECRDIATWTDRKYDIIVANPPYGMNVQMKDGMANKPEELATVAIRRFETTTTNQGHLFSFVHTNVLSARYKYALRKELTKKNYLDAVICLPDGILPHTATRLSVVVLKKNREAGAPIRMIDASQMFSGLKPRIINVDEIVKAYTEGSDFTREVSIDDIVSNLYSWDATFYNTIASETFREGFDVLSLSKILAPVRGNRRFTETEGRRVKNSTLSSDWINYVLRVDDIPMSDSLRNTQKIVSPVILLSMTGYELKVAYCEASTEKPIFISSAVYAYTLIDPHIHIGYLCMEIKKYVIPITGSAMPHINQELIAMVRIDFPSLSDPKSYEQQANLYNEAKTAKIMSKAQELGLQEVIEKMKAEYINEIRSRKHDMMPHLRQLSSARKNLLYYLNNKNQFSDKEFIGGMMDEIHNQEAAIESLSNLLKVFSRESQFGTPEVINLDKYLMEHYFDGDNYSVDYDTDYEALANYGFDIPEVCLNFDYTKGYKASIDAHPDYVEGINTYIAEDDLKRLCDNIVFNAIKHGFTDPSRNDYGLLIELTVDQKRDMFQIDFRNNGNPLPKGMDKLRYGLRGEKAGVTGGTGEGGFIVKSIAEHYGGDYDIFCENNDNVCITTVRILLPIYRENE